MSVDNVKAVVTRAMNEAEYKELLFRDPGKALEGYDLTEEESAGLKNVSREAFDAGASELEERVSRSAFDIGGLEHGGGDDLARKLPGIDKHTNITLK